ncbi:endonuclease/exonuclease/phosphatase family protein [Candidatus Daviesbacteria bacterium]|nr:endonuclease/exonuclease/phosphatase family protein [Candidatus Daviesbacteria bacterium]
MKLIALNTWGGRMYQPLMDFIKKYSQDTDIFCLQEVFKTTSNITESAGFRLNLYEEFCKILPEYRGYFASCVDNYIAGSFQPNFINFNLSWGLAIFINKKLPVTSYRDFFVFRTKDSFNPKDLNTLPRNMQYITFAHQNKKFIVCNLHGVWRKGKKVDHSSRISQSEKVVNFLAQYKEEAKILCGDFNLNINTKSLKILERDLINLIKENKIPTTRSKLYTWGDKFADYTLVSPNVKVLEFQVPDIEISDHLPMILEFS